MTEISWDSRPPDPDGVSAERQADWLADALPSSGARASSVVTWFRIRDQAPVPSYGATNQSGVYLLAGEPKPSLAAWLFPLSCRRSGGRQAGVGEGAAAGPGDRRAPRRHRLARRGARSTRGARACSQLRLAGATEPSARARAPAISRSCQ